MRKETSDCVYRSTKTLFIKANAARSDRTELIIDVTALDFSCVHYNTEHQILRM